MSTTTYTPVPLTNMDREAYLRGYTVVVDGQTLGTTYLCISGGWTGAELTNTDNNGQPYTSRTLWDTRRSATYSFIVAAKNQHEGNHQP